MTPRYQRHPWQFLFFLGQYEYYDLYYCFPRNVFAYHAHLTANIISLIADYDSETLLKIQLEAARRARQAFFNLRLSQ